MNSDQDLWSKFKRGDREAFTSIYNKHITGLLSYGKRFTTDEGILEDCVHDLFVYLWEKRETLADTDSISRYLIGSLRNNLVRALKKQSKTDFKQDEIEGDFDIQLSQESTLIKEDTLSENKHKLEKAMLSLSKRQKEAIYLKFYKLYSNAAICEIMGLNDQSLRNLLSSGVKRMKGLFANILFFLSTSIALWTLL